MEQNYMTIMVKGKITALVTDELDGKKFVMEMP